MFDETLVVQSALSAFNNAALIAPSFFWIGILWLPLMAMVRFCGRDFLARIGWHADGLKSNAMYLCAAIIMIWIIGFGGNYAVLRDAESLLPYCVAGVIFLCAYVLGAASRGHNLPKLSGMPIVRRISVLVCVAAVAFFVAQSGMPTWYGKLIPVAAVVAGGAVGRYVGRKAFVTLGVWGAMFAVLVLILMQPEFFRFGQLGALTVVHLAGLLLAGIALVAAAAITVSTPHGRIYASAYIKLKWMSRILAALGCILFLLTESVPVFVGTLGMFFIMFVLSIVHQTKIPDEMWMRMMGVGFFLVGFVTILPVISAIGVLMFSHGQNVTLGRFWRDIRFLL